jgi:hypothetical protein
MSSEENSMDSATWWDAHLNRRDVQKLGVGLATIAAMAGCDDEGTVAELDSLDAQKKGGWDVGDTAVTLTVQNATQTDSENSAGWKEFKDPKRLLETMRPKNATYRQWEMPTLIQSLEQLSLAQQMKPVSNGMSQETYKKARALGSLVTSVENPEKTMLLVDMPGAACVAAAAGMSEWVEPICFFDNWPHPRGVVKSEQVLGSLLYYAAEFAKQKAKRSDKAPGAIILDSNRLTPFTNPDKEFDNRYFAILPSAEDLKKAGVERVVYVTEKAQQQESDDLNEYAVGYAEAGIDVSSMALAEIQKDPEHKPEPGTEDPTDGYYYGGSHRTHTHFYSHYPMFIWMPMPHYGWSRPVGPAPARRPAYRPTRRPTMFSNRTTGSARGVGRVKPTGLGRVSTRMNSSGKIMGTRSGSVGRFRSSSSFGG